MRRSPRVIFVNRIADSLGLVPKPPGRPYLMGIVNSTAGSISDEPGERTVDECLERARRLVADGADLINIGGESGVMNARPLDPVEEIARVVPVIEAIVREGIPVSVDTYKPAVAKAALEAGATMIDDASGSRNPELAAVATRHGAVLGDQLVVTISRDDTTDTLAALAVAADHGVAFVRLHDVAAAHDFLVVRAALRGELEVDSDLELPEPLRRVVGK